jgi:hypothetical protein
MYCYDNNGNPTYVKTYLHANTAVVYLPLVLKNYHP